MTYQPLMSAAFHREVTSADERQSEQMMVRRFYEDGEFFRADVFVGGWRVGTYKTEAGAMRRVAKETQT